MKNTLPITTDLISEALSYVPCDCSHSEWSKIGFAIHSHDPSLFSLWDEWSSGSDAKYPGSIALERQWSKFKPEKGVGIGTLFEIAKTYGFKFTEAHFSPAAQAKRNENQERQRLERQQQYHDRLRAEAENYRNGLSRKERDFCIRELSQYVGLRSTHRQKLRERGLSDEAIAKGLFFSVTHGQIIPNHISDRFPGCRLFNGQKLLSVPHGIESGIACVAFDYEGMAVGYQIRNDDPQSPLKYPWAKAAFSSHLQTGELPITVIGNPFETLFLTEGLLKPFIAHHRFGIRCLGASSGSFTNSPLQLRTVLNGVKHIILALDAGDVQNKSILQRWKRIADSFPFSYQVWVAWWGQVEKTDNDIDELPDLLSVQYLLKNDFFSQYQ